MSGSATTIASGYAREKAESNGWRIVEPAADELFVDIDSKEEFDGFYKLIELFDDHVVDVLGWHNTPSKSGKPGRYHIVVKLAREVDATERLFFQLMLGSDRKRELLGYVRVLADDPTPTLFFEKP